ncbi:MAG TPA: S9 family peptidase [Blastocatellia bacterium]|nr:S9 family peptidase [Blastocatellia bacterium]HNG31696.1 S9 family peptidase [Blastocatellia bacterium]
MRLFIRRANAWLVSLLIVALSLPAPTLAADKRAITEMDLFKFVWIADPQISPDGSQVAFVRTWVNQKSDRYDSALWIVPTSGGAARQLTGGPRDGSPRWSPDGKTLAFIRSAEKEGRPQPPQIYLLTFGGGEAQPLTEMPRGAGNFEWSPDGKTIAFAGTEEPGKSEKTMTEAGEMKDKAPQHVSDVRVITKATYRSNGAGYTNPRTAAHIWTVSIPATPGETPKPKQVTKGKYSEGNFSWSPDGSRFFFVARRVAEPYYEATHTDLYSVAADGSDEKKVLAFVGGLGDYTFSNDGKRIAFSGSLTHTPVNSYTQPDLFVMNNEVGATPKNLTAEYDFDIGGGIGGDQSSPRGGGRSGVLWSKDDRSLIVNVAEHGRANLKRVDAATGKVEVLTKGDHTVQAYSATPDASKMALLISTSVNIHDLFLLDTASGKLTQLTKVNDELFSQLNLTHPEEIWYTSFDGRKIQGWIQKPPNFDPSKKYPFILEIHGGPHSAYGFIFTHEFQWMAAKGYVVLYTNPRGSTSYGQDFGNIIQHNYPGDDHKDLMAGVDEVLKRGYIDEKKLGVTGGSGGGVLTNWAVGKTNRFAAAVSQRSIADWAGFWYTADFTLFQPTWFKAAPWEDPEDFVKRSPITYVKNITTPMMFIEGEADYRTPPADGGEIMFRALKFRKIPTAMIRFPNESHELSRSGAPWHRVERLQHILNWFDKYLQDKPIKLYDVE